MFGFRRALVASASAVQARAMGSAAPAAAAAAAKKIPYYEDNNIPRYAKFAMLVNEIGKEKAAAGFAAFDAKDEKAKSDPAIARVFAFQEAENSRVIASGTDTIPPGHIAGGCLLVPNGTIEVIDASTMGRKTLRGDNPIDVIKQTFRDPEMQEAMKVFFGAMALTVLFELVVVGIHPTPEDLPAAFAELDRLEAAFEAAPPGTKYSDIE